MAWAKRTATDFKDCLAQIVDFATKTYFAGAVTPGSNTGNGIVYGASASENSVAETWTLTCTTGGGSETAVFSVVGSVSGAKASATVDIPYSIPEMSFIILAGAVDFIIGDSFTFDVASGTALWAVNESDLVSTQQYALMQGVGGGSDEIFVGFRTESDAATYFNMRIAAFSGYVSGNMFTNQPGLRSFYTCLSNVSFDFWIRTTGRHIYITPIIGTIYGAGYTGWFLPNATQAQYAYPAYVGGSTDYSATLVGSTENRHCCFWNSVSGSYYTGAVNDGSSWASINTLIPRSYGAFSSFFPDINGNRTIYNAELVKESSSTIYGRLEGIYYVVNGDSAITANDILNTGTKGLVVFQDVFRTGTTNVIAVDLMGD